MIHHELPASLLGCALLFACSDQTTSADDPTGPSAPLYVVANEVYADDESTSYVTVLSSLDIDELALDDAIEFPGGRATITTRAGWVFVAPPTSPEIRRFRVTNSGRLEPDGVVSFLNYGLDGLALDGWGNTFISDTKAYVHNLVDGTSVIWNPTEMTIVGEVDVGDFELVRPDLGDLNGSAGVARGSRLFRTIFGRIGMSSRRRPSNTWRSTTPTRTS